MEAGGNISVPIKIQFDQPTRVRNIRAEFVAAEKTEATYTTTSTDSEGKTTTQTHTATEFFHIAQQEFLLMGEPRKGFFSRLFDSMATWFGGGSHEKVGPGEREFSVDLQLPLELPASFKGENCEIFYRLTVHVDVPIRLDWSESFDFEVVPEPPKFEDTKPVHVVFPDENGRSFWDGLFGKDVTLNVALDRSAVSCGETALGMLTIETPKPLKLNDIEITLVGVESTVAQGHHDAYTHRHEIGSVDSPNLISSESTHEFEVPFPVIDGPFSQSGKNFEVNWNLEIRLKVPWAKDPVIQVPIVLLPSPSILEKHDSISM